MLRPLSIALLLSCGVAMAGEPWPEPRNLAPQDWLVIGPFPNAPAPEQGQPRPGLDRDYLSDLGGEAAARIVPETRVRFEGETYSVRPARMDSGATIDLHKAFGGPSTFKVAYAYVDWTVPEARTLHAWFGSDDAPAVWLNGKRIHRLPTPGRGIDPSSDQFDLPLRAGGNRLLVKVENGGGGWGFALQAYDEEGLKLRRALQARRNLEALDPGPENDNFILDQSFPTIVWRNVEAGRLVFGDQPIRVRWFGPDLSAVEAPDAAGAYTAVIEATTADGFTYRRMLTFAKIPRVLASGGFAPPFVEPPLLRLPAGSGWTVRPGNAAQQAELSRHIWRAMAQYFTAGEDAAIAAAALFEMASAKEPGPPAFLDSGFIRNAERQLRLRMKLDGRRPHPLPPPTALDSPAPELRAGSETEAGLRSGTVDRLRQLCGRWIADDPNGFVVLVARRGVIVMHEGFGGYEADTPFYPASLGKTIAGLTFARAVDAGLLGIDQKVGDVLPDWSGAPMSQVTFRYLFNHMDGLLSHTSLGGMYNAYLDNGLYVQDGVFAHPGRRFFYNGDDYNLAGKALELTTGQTIWRLLYEQMQAPFGEPVSQFDLGYGTFFNAAYLAKVGQMLLQDGRYGGYQFYEPGLVQQLFPKRFADSVPESEDETTEWGIGMEWMMDPQDATEGGVLGRNVVGHGSASGCVLRVAPDHQLVVVIGRNAFKDGGANGAWAAQFMKILADGMR